VGEGKAAMPLVEAVCKRWPDARVLVSATTQTGLTTWNAWLDGPARHLKKAVFSIPAPLDFPCIIRRFRRLYRPDCMIFIETDLWPNWIWDFRDNGIPSLLLNGAISSKSARRLGCFKSLAMLLYGGLEAISMQSQEDKNRLLGLGLAPERILVLGNLKQAVRLSELNEEERSLLEGSLGLTGKRVWVAGSTHEMEEAVCLKAHAGLLKSIPGLKCVIAPRDVKRAGEIQSIAEANGLVSCLRSGLRWTTDYDVLILDTLGELADVYSLADVAFVGGSLVPVGGHNLLEPAIHGVPVLFGRYVESCQEVAQRLKAAGGGFECEADSLESVLYELLTNEERRKEAGLQAKRIAACDADVIERHLDLIERVLTHARGR